MKICPIMTAGWLGNGYMIGAQKYDSPIGTPLKGNMVQCLGDKCMMYRDGECGLTNKTK